MLGLALWGVNWTNSADNFTEELKVILWLLNVDDVIIVITSRIHVVMDIFYMYNPICIGVFEIQVWYGLFIPLVYEQIQHQGISGYLH